MLYGKKPIGSIGYLGGLQSLPEPFCWAWGQMIQYNQDYLCESNEMIAYLHSTVSFHAFARNNLVDQMLGEWLLMLDTDMVFEPDVAARMVHTMTNYHIDVLAGLYQYKSPPHSPVIYRWNGEGLQPIGKWEGDVDIFEIGSAGAGCLMVKRSVFDRIRKELKCGAFDIIHPLGEDHSFFKRLKELGIKAYCNPSIQVQHLAYKPVQWTDYDTTDLDFGTGMQLSGLKLED